MQDDGNDHADYSNILLNQFEDC